MTVQFIFPKHESKRKTTYVIVALAWVNKLRLAIDAPCSTNLFTRVVFYSRRIDSCLGPFMHSDLMLE